MTHNTYYTNPVLKSNQSILVKILFTLNTGTIIANFIIDSFIFLP